MSGAPELTTRIGRRPGPDTPHDRPTPEPGDSPSGTHPTNPATGFNPQGSHAATGPMAHREPAPEAHSSPSPTRPTGSTGINAQGPHPANRLMAHRRPGTEAGISSSDTRPTDPATIIDTARPPAASGPMAPRRPRAEAHSSPSTTRPTGPATGIDAAWPPAPGPTTVRRRPGSVPRPSLTPADDGTWSADPYAYALRTGRGPLFLRRADGWLLLLEVERWCAEADAVDLEVLRRCEGAVLDVGCGPGRLVVALGERGLPVLGIDVSEAAVARTVALGGQALRRSVFEPLPAEGRWGTALLLDGNVGIGGDPRALLDRMTQLLAPGGLLIAETVPDPDVDERVRVHVTDARGATSSPFPWARLGTPALLRHARRAGWRAADQWTTGGRCFVALRSRSRDSGPVTGSRRAKK